MEKTIRGKVFVLGDNVDTDQIIPAEYLSYNPADPAERKFFGRYALSGVPIAQSGLPGQEDVVDTVLSHEACLFETDAVIRSSGHPNPAATGTFPRILGRHVRRKQLFSLPSAVRRMTAASADRFGLTDRGRLQPGLAADIVVFDPERVDDRPGSDTRPAGPPRGISQVFINGAHLVADGHFVEGVRAGRVLRV